MHGATDNGDLTDGGGHGTGATLGNGCLYCRVEGRKCMRVSTILLPQESMMGGRYFVNKAATANSSHDKTVK